MEGEEWEREMEKEGWWGKEEGKGTRVEELEEEGEAEGWKK